MEHDIEALGKAMRLFFQTMKRPHHWARIARRARVALDRPSAMMLQALLSQPHDHRRVHDLANLLGIEAPSVTRKSQELEQAGYVRRVPDKHDRRAISLQVTPRGRAVSERISQAQRELIREALSAWDKESRRKFVKLFQQFTENLAIASIEQPVEKGKKIGEK